MEATKYMKAYEAFIESEDDSHPDKSPKSTANLVGEYIDSLQFFGVISSFVPGNDPDVSEDSHKQLHMDLLKLHIGCYEQKFGYIYTDGSGQHRIETKNFLVPGIEYDQLIELGRKYEQEWVALGGAGKLDVIRLSDESVVMTMTNQDLHLAWNLILGNPRQTPWSTVKGQK